VAEAGSPAAGGEGLVVGRARELASAAALIAALPAGPRALLLRGPPGIGKTTLWRSAGEAARAAGLKVLVARPAEEEMPLALVGLVDLFESAGVSSDELLAADDPFARGRVVLDELRRLAGAAPTLVAIDDLQWLDAGSARALRYALRRLADEPVGVVATLRVESGATDDPLRLVEGFAPDRVEAIDLAPLSVGAIRGVLGRGLASISRPMLRRIHETSGGNPLYALELARAAASRGSTYQVWSRLPLPPSLRAAIADRLDGAPVELAPLLETTAALGPAALAELRGALPDADVDRLVVLAQEHALLTLEDDLSVRFAHPLVGSAVYERLDPLARRSLHGRLAEHTADADVRARHLAISTDAPDEGVAVLLEQAARRASDRGAPELAAEFANRSLRLTPPDEADAAHRRALAAIGYVAAAGEVGRAVAAADALVATLPPGPRRAEALAQRVYFDLDTGEQLLLRALDEAGDDAVLRGRLLDLLGWVRATFRGDLARGLASAREALELGERLGDERLQMLSEASLAIMETLRAEPDSGRLARAAALAREVGEPPLGRGPAIMLGRKQLWDGELDAAREAFARTAEQSRRSGTEFQRPYRLYDLAVSDYAAGELEAALDHAREGLEAAGDAHNTDGLGWLLYPLGLAEAGLGRATEARAAASGLIERSAERGATPGIVRGHGVLGLLALSEGDAPTAASELLEATRLLDAMGIAHPGAFPALADVVEALAARGEIAGAAARLELLEAAAVSTASPWPAAAARRARGHVLLAGQQADEAAAAFGDAAGRFEELGYRLDAARSELARGRALIRAGRRTAAADVLARTRRRFAAAGAVLWEARAAEELDRASPGRAAGELTAAERRVAALVAEGRKNREIGQTLYMSVATVEAHLTRIYRKLDLRSRSELARLVAEGAVGVEDAERG
jgi:DNA-binding CsgD family transcriptional regulator